MRTFAERKHQITNAMEKELQYLKKGDKIWFVDNYECNYEFSNTNPPKIYGATITEDSTPQGTLPFPEYCLVHYYCPALNPNHLTSSEHGENTEGQNGHLFFTDHEKCLEYVKNLANKRLKYAERKLKALQEDIKEIKEILGEN